MNYIQDRNGKQYNLDDMVGAASHRFHQGDLISFLESEGINPVLLMQLSDEFQGTPEERCQYITQWLRGATKLSTKAVDSN